MFKKLFSLTFIVVAISQATPEKIKFDRSHLFVPQSLGKTKLYRDNNNFIVKNNGIASIVKNHDKDSILRQATKEQMKEFIKHGYISIHKLDNGDFKLNSHVRGLGGGVVGAEVGAWIGKGLVHVIGHGTIWVVSFAVNTVSGEAAAIPTGMALEGTLSPAIEAASNVGAIVGGIIGGVLTGPVG